MDLRVTIPLSCVAPPQPAGEMARAARPDEPPMTGLPVPGGCLPSAITAATMPMNLPMSPDDTVHDDICLLDRIVAHEAEAIGELYDRHSRLLFGLIYRILRSRDEAEEVLQDVFVQVWKRADTYKAELGVPLQWLVGIARHRAIDRLRANAVRLRTMDATLLPAPTQGPEAWTLQTEQQRVLARALDGLRVEERQLLEHAYFQGLTQSELAERFNLPLGTVKTRIRTALSTLRRALQHTMAEARG
jgi:RNA polymerase sigma-70 factor (ECF subfamily)